MLLDKKNIIVVGGSSGIGRSAVKAFLNEGVYDKGIFKAFFLAGGPGSGKSFVTQAAFAGVGLKIVNSDTIFERGLLKANHFSTSAKPPICSPLTNT